MVPLIIPSPSNLEGRSTHAYGDSTTVQLKTCNLSVSLVEASSRGDNTNSVWRWENLAQ